MLVKKLNEIGLNFYPVRYKSGFTGRYCGYCLYSTTSDGTPFRFFQLIGFECPPEIANCTTGRKGRYGEVKCFKDKWPTTKDWIKILSQVSSLGNLFKQRRLELNLSQARLAKLVGCSREHIRDIENSKRLPSVKMFEKLVEKLGLNVMHLLNFLNDYLTTLNTYRNDYT